MVEEYMSTLKTLYPTNENRIRFLNEADDHSDPTYTENTGSGILLLNGASQLQLFFCCLLAFSIMFEEGA